MKHDLNLIHDILKHVEKSTSSAVASDIVSTSTDNEFIIDDHIRLLIDKELVHGQAKTEKKHVIHGLTAEGHALLHALGNDSVRRKIRTVATSMGEKMTFEVVLEIVKTFLMEAL